MAILNSVIVISILTSVVLGNPATLQALYGAPLEDESEHPHLAYDQHTQAHEHYHKNEHSHGHSQLGLRKTPDSGLFDTANIVSEKSDSEYLLLFGTPSKISEDPEIQTDLNKAHIRSSLSTNLGRLENGAGSRSNVRSLSHDLEGPRSEIGGGTSFEGPQSGIGGGTSFEGPRSGIGGVTSFEGPRSEIGGVTPTFEDSETRGQSRIAGSVIDGTTSRSAFTVNVFSDSPGSIIDGSAEATHAFQVRDFDVAVTGGMSGTKSGLVSGDDFIGNHLGVTVAELSGGTELTPSEIAAGFNYDSFKDVTLTHVSTIDVFTTVTNVFFNSVPVTLTEFIKTTLVYPTLLVVATPVDDHVFVATAPVTRTHTLTVTDTHTAYQYVTEVSTVVFMVTHRAYEIHQQIVLSTVVQTQLFRPTVVSTLILTEMDTSTVQYTMTDTVVVDLPAFTRSPALHHDHKHDGHVHGHVHKHDHNHHGASQGQQHNRNHHHHGHNLIQEHDLKSSHDHKQDGYYY